MQEDQYQQQALLQCYELAQPEFPRWDKKLIFQMDNSNTSYDTKAEKKNMKENKNRQKKCA